MKYRYHLPSGDLTLTAKKQPVGGRVDLYDDSGDIKVSNCEVAAREGACAPLFTEKDDQSEDDDPGLTKDKVKSRLDELNIEYDSRLGLKKLIELLTAAEEEQTTNP